MVARVTPVNRSGTIASGGTAQVFAPANPNRHGFTVQNQSVGDLYVSVGSSATANQNSLKIPPGELYEWPYESAPSGAISIIGATTGQAFFGEEY